MKSIPLIVAFAALLLVSISPKSIAQGTCDGLFIASDAEVPEGSHLPRSVWALIKAKVIGECFDDQSIGHLTTDVSQTLQDIGYLHATVTMPRFTVIDSSRYPESALVSFSIREGDRYTVREISIAGNRVLNADQIWGVSPIELGEFLDMNKVRATGAAIQQLYAANGFPSAQATPHIESLPGTYIRVVFSIREGTQSH